MYTAFALSDRLGNKGVAKLEETMTEFNQWCSSKLAEAEEKTGNPGEKRHVSLSQESYTGSAKRVFNTYHM